MTSSLPDDLAAYDFALPDDLIAQSPSPERDGSRLLVIRKNPGPGQKELEDRPFKDLPEIIASEPQLKNALWVRNRTKVFPARFYAKRSSGSRHEIVLVAPQAPGQWKAIIRKSAVFSYPQILAFEKDPSITFTALGPELLDFSNLPKPIHDLLEEHGEMPLPPYIKERDATRDRARYQTVWAREDKKQSVAAPTASLHFTPEVIAKIEALGNSFADVTLHVGLGTFAPVRTEKISQHELHAEQIEVDAANIAKLEKALTNQQPIACIGTTALRTLESLPLLGSPPKAGAVLSKSSNGDVVGSSQLFIRPGSPPERCRVLLTNFHLPQSTLFVLVSVFCGDLELAKRAYEHAISQKYRFFSYGDATLWIV